LDFVLIIVCFGWNGIIIDSDDSMKDPDEEAGEV